MQKSASYEWYSAMIAAAVLMLRAVLRLMSGPPELGQSPSAERMDVFFLVVLAGVMIYGLASLTRITLGREDMRTFTAITLGLGLISAVTLLLIGD